MVNDGGPFAGAAVFVARTAETPGDDVVRAPATPQLEAVALLRRNHLRVLIVHQPRQDGRTARRQIAPEAARQPAQRPGQNVGDDEIERRRAAHGSRPEPVLLTTRTRSAARLMRRFSRATATEFRSVSTASTGASQRCATANARMPLPQPRSSGRLRRRPPRARRSSASRQPRVVSWRPVPKAMLASIKQRGSRRAAGRPSK